MSDAIERPTPSVNVLINEKVNAINYENKKIQEIESEIAGLEKLKKDVEAVAHDYVEKFARSVQQSTTDIKMFVTIGATVSINGLQSELEKSRERLRNMLNL
jgi:hypothetical protein